MSKHRGGKNDFAEHPARARDEVKKGGKKAEVTSPTITTYTLTQARILAGNSLTAMTVPLKGKGMP
ncbi:hypothetical protein [[Erwinia] mediterraneensis]|uniref:hypothetical protein n=1 Tax=[Erwinia] mediterraneensis TaxID=2161819 RepID=UPI001A926DFE|nr:hypothetical protein [[Erwinia] mediterraneensis]